MVVDTCLKGKGHLQLDFVQMQLLHNQEHFMNNSVLTKNVKIITKTDFQLQQMIFCVVKWSSENSKSQNCQFRSWENSELA